MPELYNTNLLQLEGCEVEEIVKKRTRRVTNDQNAYYYGVILPICFQHEAFSHYNKSDDIHEDYFADKFLSYTKVVTLPDGKVVNKTKVTSTSSLSSEEMSKFIEKVLMDAAQEFGLIIKTPEEYFNTLYK